MAKFEPFNDTFLLVINSFKFIGLLFAKVPKKDNTEALRGKLADTVKTIARVSQAVAIFISYLDPSV